MSKLSQFFTRSPRPHTPRRRGSSQNMRAPTGLWSIRLPNGTYLVEGVSESVAWRRFLDHQNFAELLKGEVVMACRTDQSPIISRVRCRNDLS